MHIGLISLFPEMFTALNYGITGRAIDRKLVELSQWNPRNYSQNKHHNVDDRPYGGGPGMVMSVQPLRDAIHAARAQLGQPSKTIYLSPQGKLLTQTAVQHFSTQPALILIAGRYEGIDERLIKLEVDEEWSVGDYILSGGELAAMVLVDAIIRLLPGALGHEDSAEQDSFMQGLLDYPHFTRPETINNLQVPEVLLSGDHAAIARWRLQQSLGRTWQRRPDLLQKRMLSYEEEILLNDYINAYNSRLKK